MLGLDRSDWLTLGFFVLVVVCVFQAVLYSV